MVQRYKVFNDKRVIEFCSTAIQVTTTDNQILVIETVDNLLEYSSFVDQLADSIFHIIIVSEHPEVSLKRFFYNFQWLEAAGGLVKKENSYLFIQRFGCWDLPKGKIETDETPDTAAVREIEEECGIVNPILEQFITHTYHTYQYQEQACIKKNWWFELSYTGNDELIPQLEEGITAVQWVSSKDLDQIRNNTYPSIVEVLDAVGL
jgi:8-oxo-dGTP pyrophosphatase MutT (NUDIX family)